ncbi:putative glucose-1-phosphate adenylyltransferase [Helianthus anomalus]
MSFIATMGIYVSSKNVMLDLLREKFTKANDFGSEVIPGFNRFAGKYRRLLYAFFHFLTIYHNLGACIYDMT